MRKTIATILSLLVVLAMTLAITACGGNGDDNGGTTAPSPTPGTPPTTPGDPPGDTGEAPPAAVPRGNIHPVVDLGGREIRIVSWGTYNMGGSAPYEEPDPEDPNYFIHRMQYDNMRRVEEQFNVTIIHVDGGDYGMHREGFLASQVAGNPDGEIIRAPGSLLIPALAGGHALVLSDITMDGITFDLLSNQSVTNVSAAIGADIYTVRGASPLGMGPMLAVNMDLVNSLGLPNPVALYEAGTWTWEHLMNIMRLASAQGYFGIAGTQGDLTRLLIGSNDGILVDANLNYAANHPNTVAAFDQMATIFQERLWRWNPDDPGDPFGGWARQQHGFVEGADTVFFTEPSWVINLEAPFHFEMIPFPVGPANTSGNTHVVGLAYGVLIPVGTPNPGEILMIIEELHSWAYGNEWMLIEAVAESLRGRLHTEACVQRAIHTANNTRAIDIGWSIEGGLGWLIYALHWDLFHGYSDAAEMLETERAPRQELLDNLFR